MAISDLTWMAILCDVGILNHAIAILCDVGILHHAIAILCDVGILNHANAIAILYDQNVLPFLKQSMFYQSDFVAEFRDTS